MQGFEPTVTLSPTATTDSDPHSEGPSSNPNMTGGDRVYPGLDSPQHLKEKPPLPSYPDVTGLNGEIEESMSTGNWQRGKVYKIYIYI